MVQVYVLTAGGIRYLLIGPVIHLPEIGLFAKNIEELEFGEIIPAELASQMLSTNNWPDNIPRN